MTGSNQEKKTILAVSFGTSHHGTCEKNIGAIEADLKAAFPGWEVRRAFTSGKIINKLKQRDNKPVDTVEEALERLLSEGCGTVICQPTHIINGEEFDDIAVAAGKFKSSFSALRLGAPLLTSAQDYKGVAAVIGESFQPDEGRALCLMGHGTTHPADSAYAALEYHFRDQGFRNIFVGTVEGFPDLGTLLRHVEDSGVKRVILAPLMVVAGDHAVNDMAHDGDSSWKTAFERAGFAVKCVLKGLGEYPEIREMYVAHVQTEINTLG